MAGHPGVWYNFVTSRPHEQRADKFSQDAEQGVKQNEKQENKQKEHEEP